MPAKHPPRKGTLASYAESGQPFLIVCSHCDHYARPDYLELVHQGGGWATMMADILPRLRCRRCHRRAAEFRLTSGR
jgi:hypothetical protein